MNSHNPPQHIALDPGFGGYKAAAVRAGQLVVVALPSVVGVGDTNTGLLDLAGPFGVGRRRRRPQPRRVAFDGIELLVGPGVANYTRPVERLDFQRLSEGPELRALTYATLGELLHHDAAVINLVVGLPVEVLQGPSARATVRQLQSWLLGAHQFTVDDQSLTLCIQALQPIAQPVGAFCEWGLALDGRWARDRADFDQPVAVLDLGFNTLDLFTVQSGQINVRYTQGDTLGIRRAATALVEHVRRQHQRELSLHEADALLQQYVRHNGRQAVQLPIAGQTIDVGPAIRAALDTAAGEILSFLDRTWGTGRQFRHLLLTGGGCLLWRDRLLERFPHATLLDDPVTANARGLARLAQRPGLFR